MESSMTGEERTVIVVGRTGAGKSEFIKQSLLDADPTLDPDNLPKASSGIISCTQFTNVYEIPGTLASARYQLVDTKGMLDSSRDDETVVAQLAELIDKLHTIVGVVYLVQGRMDPSEVEICEFLFSTFFDEVPEDKLLVVLTKTNDWKTYNVAEQKEALKKQNPEIPAIIHGAEWVPVDFNKFRPKEELKEMVNRIRLHFARWTKPLTLSDRMQAAEDFVPYYKQVEMNQAELKTANEALEQIRNEKADLETRMQEEIEKAKGGDETARLQVEILMKQQENAQIREQEMLKLMMTSQQQMQENMIQMQEKHNRAQQEMMGQIAAASADRGPYCSIM